MFPTRHCSQWVATVSGNVNHATAGGGPIDLLATADCDRIACFSLLQTAVGDNLPACGAIDNTCQKIATPTSQDTPPCGNAIAAE